MHDFDEQVCDRVKALVDEQLFFRPLSPPEATPTQRKCDTRKYHLRPKRQAAADDICFSCKGHGHFAWECPTKRSKGQQGNNSQPIPGPKEGLVVLKGQQEITKKD